MEPRIQYAKTSDGVKIAYWTMGEGGTPLVLTSPMLFCHAALELRSPPLRAWYERLASRRMIVRYDDRGQGLSQRNVGRVGAESFATDLLSIIEALSLDQLDAFGFYSSCTTMIWYASKHPDLVRRLILWRPTTNNQPYFEEELPTVLSLIQRDWRLFTETYARTAVGWTGDLAHELATFMRRAISQEDAANLFEAILRGDVEQKLSLVRAPTLVLYHAEGRGNESEAASHVAANIEGARLVPLEHKLIPPFESAPGLAVIEAFLSDGDGRTAREARRDIAFSGTAIILFADIADSTALTERLGDTAFRDKARELDAALRKAISSNGGTAIDGKLLGDGVLATFGAAHQAIACAAQCHQAGSHAGLRLHVGIHAGDVIRESNNVFGGAVNIAARVADEAHAGETLVSDIVRGLAKTSAGVSFEDRGEHALKGVGEPVRLYEVRWREEP